MPFSDFPEALTPPAAKTYAAFLAGLKERIRSAQVRAAFAVHRELTRLYWEIGRDLVGKGREDGWGTQVVERLARDLRAAFPGTKGFSARNLWRMRAFFLAYPDEILPQPVAELP